MRKLLLLLPLIYFSCNVHFVPAKSKFAVDATTQIQTDVDKMYNIIAGSPDKTYLTYSLQYLTIEGEIDSLISYDRTRANVANIVHQLVILRSAVVEYENEHKAANTMTPSEARVYKSYLDSYLHTILVSENSLK